MEVEKMAESSPKSEKKIKDLMNRLVKASTNEFYNIIPKIAAMGSDAIPYLFEYLRDEQNQRRWLVNIVFSNMIAEAEIIVPELIPYLRSDIYYIRNSTFFVLSSFGEKSKLALPVLEELLSTTDDSKEKFEIACTIINIEGKEGLGTKVILNLIKKRQLTSAQISEFELLCQELQINKQIEEIKAVVESSGNPTLIAKIQALETTLSDTRRLSLENQKTSEQFKGLFGKKEGDFILELGNLSKDITYNKECIETLERTLLNNIDRLEKKVDNELKNKHVMEGIWKGFVITGSILSIISIIGSIVLVIVKIVEITKT